MANKWRTVVDAAGVERRVRHVDAREIEEAAQGNRPEPAEVVVAEMVEVDDQSVAPKVGKKGK
jgi:hypothetical protein